MLTSSDTVSATTAAIDTQNNFSLNYLSLLNGTYRTDTEVTGDTDVYPESAWLIQVIGRPILTVFGTIGNLLVFYIMRKGSLKNVSTCFYMAILALADTGMLWTGAFVWWIFYLTRFRVDPEVWTDCKLGYFIFHFCQHYSSTLLSIMSVEKFLALYFPLKTKRICTVSVARKVCGVTAVIFAAFNFQFFFVYDVRITEGSTDHCAFVRVPENYKATFHHINSTLYTFAPFAIMIAANGAIIYKFMKAKFKSKKRNGIGPAAANQALSKSSTRGTAMLVTVSTMFIILTGPVSFTMVSTTAPSPVVYAIITFLLYVNHSINGVLYCIVGPKFRAELLKTFGFRKRNSIANAVASTNRAGNGTTASPI